MALNRVLKKECITTRMTGDDRMISARNQLPASALEKIVLK